MTREEFQRLAAEGYNRIPLTCETLADFDTPLSIYLKLADGPNTYLLEPVQGGEKWGRYSIIGLPSRTVLRVYGHQASIKVDGVETESFECADPLAFVEAFKDRYRVPTIAGLIPAWRAAKPGEVMPGRIATRNRRRFVKPMRLAATIQESSQERPVGSSTPS